jgi:hypothetical protein
MKEITLEIPAVVENAEKLSFDRTKNRIVRWTAMLYLSVVAGILCASTGLTLGAIS